jgi:uncharacterized membrane protein YphA (DoxX/SURF4 family)
MSAKNLRAIYWVVTLLFVLPQAWSAVQYLSEAPAMTETITALGYPVYFMKILAVAKLLGIAAILFGRFPTLKEWAYAGFTFDVLGAFLSHVMSGDSLLIALVPLLFLAAQLGSYFLWRKLGRKVPATDREPPHSRPLSTGAHPHTA